MFVRSFPGDPKHYKRLLLVLVAHQNLMVRPYCLKTSHAFLRGHKQIKSVCANQELPTGFLSEYWKVLFMLLSEKKHQLCCSAVSLVIDSNAKCGKICPWVHIIHCPGGRGQAEALMPSEEELASQKESALGCDPQLSHWVPISWRLLHHFYRAIALQWERQKAKTTKTRSLSV